MNSGCWSSTVHERRGQANSSPTPERTVTDSGKNTSATPSPMKTANQNDAPKAGFEANLPAGFESPTNDVGRRLLKEYGAVFIARGGAVPPKTVIFRDEAAVLAFQRSLSISSETIGGITIELQAPAMAALKKAIDEARGQGKRITSRGSDAARRSYAGTVELWKSRVEPGLAHWTGKGRITKTEADRIRGLSPFEQVPEIFRLEGQGIFFAKDLSKSIIYSVAPPGTSQHLSLLALDVEEHNDPAIRTLLAKHGWYQTVVSDLPHFTFLGVNESELSSLGLKKTSDGGRDYWLPAL